MKKILLFACILAGCTAQKKLAAPATEPHNIVVEGKLFTALFQQRAAEYTALCFQAYNIAQLRLQQALQKPHTKPLAVVTDIDETALNNSPYAVHQGLQQKDYEPESWIAWTDMAKADTIPGAKTFFSYAAANNVAVFYVTNRSEKERAATLKNLQRYGFPFADEAHLLLKNETSSKEARRQTIQATYEIVLLIGDNLADLSVAYDDKQYEQRLQNTQALAPAFGGRFIVLPNANYGDWETGIYSNKMTAWQKDSAVKSRLIGY